MNEELRLRLVEDQQRYEAEAVERGIHRYREDLRRAKLDGSEVDTGPGRRMMVAILSEMIPYVERMQTAAAQSVVTRATVRWALPLLSLGAEKWAYIAARTAVSFARSERTVTAVSLAIVGRAKEERELEMMLEAQAAERRKLRAEGKEMPAALRRILASVGTLRPRQVRHLKKRIGVIDRLEWSASERANVGRLMVEALVQHGGGWFELALVERVSSGRLTTEARIRLTPLAVEFLEHHHSQSELTRPWRLPMLCPPNDWRITMPPEPEGDPDEAAN